MCRILSLRAGDWRPFATGVEIILQDQPDALPAPTNISHRSEFLSHRFA
jgi:hypothetical protein